MRLTFRPLVRILAACATLLPASIGCGGGPQPSAEVPDRPADEPPAPTATAVASATAEAPPCEDAHSCEAEGVAALEAGDVARGQALLERGCALGGGGACRRLGNRTGSATRARELWEKGCTLGDADSCVAAAETVQEEDLDAALALYDRGCEAHHASGDAAGLLRSCRRGALLAFGQDRHEDTRRFAAKGCDALSHALCGVLGVLYAKGLGGPQDLAAAKVALMQGCETGDQEACDNALKLADAVAEAEARKAVEAEANLTVPGANVTMGSITVDGATVEDVSCRAGVSGLAVLMAGPGLMKPIADRHRALQACGASGSVRLRWTAAGGRVSRVEAKGASPAIEACVVRALSGASAAMPGTCAATLRLAP